MSFEQYRDRKVTIKSTGVNGTISNVLPRRGTGGGMSVRFLVVDDENNTYELMPHEVTFINHEQKTDQTGAAV